jgi:hypothetical protein
VSKELPIKPVQEVMEDEDEEGVEENDKDEQRSDSEESVGSEDD